MKNLLAFLAFLCLSANSLAQNKETLKLQNQFWNSANKKQHITDIPEKWSGESAVILYLEENYTYTNSGRKMKFPSFWHQRVKLLDKAAVENYSEFSYEKNTSYGSLFRRWNQSKTIMGIKIIKPDGTESIVDIEKMKVKQDDEIKIALPGLEIGDIVDVFIYKDDFTTEYYGVNVFDPVETVLNGRYPIVYRKISIEVENDFYLNMETYNGAPKIQEVPTDRRATKKYILEATDLEKRDFPRWFYPLVEFPALKFQVVFALNGRSAEAFLGDYAVRKTGVSEEEILEYYGERFDTYNRKDVKDVVKYLEEKGITDKREQMVQALYYIRHKTYNRFIELVVADENKIEGYGLPCDQDYIILQESNFVNYMAGLAKQLEVDYDIIVATADYNGSIDDLLLRSNVSHGLRFNFADPLYFFHISPHVQAELFPENLENTKVYTLSVKKNRKVESVGTDVLPSTTAKDNVENTIVKVDFEEGFDVLNIQRKMDFSGHFKVEELNSRLFFNDFLNEEFDRYETKHFFHCRKNQNRKEEEVEKKMNAFYASLKEKHDKKLSERAKSSLNVTEVMDYEYEIVEASRYSNKPLVVTDDFTIKKEFIQRAGPNFLFEAGKFIGNQVQIKADEENRDTNIYIDYAKTFSHQVEIEIPEGYEVVGLDKLTKNISNNTGSFVSTASVENGMLKYSAKKVYAKSRYTVTEWKDMLPWLKAAYEFSQEKIMFKKI